MNFDLYIYAILETRYKKLYELPVDWYKIVDIKLKNEILSQALNKNKNIEELKIYNNIIGEE